MVSKEEIDDYQFTKRQRTVYNSLIKATERCKKAGLTLIAKQDSLYAYPSKFANNDMMIVSGFYEQSKGVLCPYLNGASISDAGADDMEYIKDKYIK